MRRGGLVETETRPRSFDSGGMLPASARSLELDAFRGFPYGLIVLDRRGKIVCRNHEAARLIQTTGLPEAQLDCCTLLGCRRPHTGLANVCLTEVAMSREGPLPEVRVDIRTVTGSSGVWVAAGRFGRHGTRVVLQLRPLAARDCDQNQGSDPDRDPQWDTAPQLRIRCLGRTVVESAEGPIRGAWLEQRTGQLLKYLVTERRRPVTVDEIAESIWPEADYAAGVSVRYYVHALRRRLEPLRGSREQSAFVVAQAGTYRLELERVLVDADEFEAHIGAGFATTEPDPQVAIGEIECALAMYRGEFLADLPYAEWAMAERDRLHDLACKGLRRLVDMRLERDEVEAAARCLERLATLQPYDEDVHRRLMELDIMHGRRSDAVRRYATLRSRIRRTFGHDPAFTPADLSPPRR
jgi:DNA-binding SARP family transcriptional activator